MSLRVPCPGCGASLNLPPGCASGACRSCGAGFLIRTNGEGLFLQPLPPAGGDGQPGSESPGCDGGPGPENPGRSARLPPWLLERLKKSPRLVWAGLAGVLLLLLVLRGAGGDPEPRSVRIAEPGTLAAAAAETVPTAPATAEVSQEVPEAEESMAPEPSPTPFPAEPASSPQATPSPRPTASPGGASPSPLPLPNHGSINGRAVEFPRRLPVTAASPTTRAEPAEVEGSSSEPIDSSEPSDSGAQAAPSAEAEARTARVGLEELRAKPLVVVTRVDRTALACTVWFLTVNTTSANLDFEAPKVLDARGVQLERSLSLNWDSSDGTSEPDGVYGHWPAFHLARGQSPVTLVFPTEQFGEIRVPAEERMSNYGPWDSLSDKVRDRVEDELRHFSGMRWWNAGLDASRRTPLDATIRTDRPLGY